MVEDNFNTRMWADGPENQFYINAMMPDYDIAKRGVSGLSPGWQLQVGWCAGAITGYALLKMGSEESCARSRKMMDRIAGGISPSGLFWSIYANGSWDAKNNGAGWQHMRMSADATFYFLKAIALERAADLSSRIGKKRRSATSMRSRGCGRNTRTLAIEWTTIPWPSWIPAQPLARFVSGLWRLAPACRMEKSTFPLHARRVKHFTSDLCAPAGLSLGRWTFPMRPIPNR